MVVTVHPYARLGKGRAHQRRENLIQGGGLRTTQLQAQMPAEIPLPEQLQLAPQQNRVVLGQKSGIGENSGLQDNQRSQGIAVQALDRGFVELSQIQLLTEIGEQQVASCQILLQHLRDIEPEMMQAACDLDERPRVFLVGWRIHHDVGGAIAADTEITAETRIRGCWTQFVLAEIEHLANPVLECFESVVQGNVSGNVPANTASARKLLHNLSFCRFGQLHYNKGRPNTSDTTVEKIQTCLVKIEQYMTL